MKKNIVYVLLLAVLVICSGCTGRRSVVYETFSGSVTENSQEEAESEDAEDAENADQKETENSAEEDKALKNEAKSKRETEEQTEEISLFVDLSGEVKYPGVYELQEGNRIFHAIRAAGGFTDQAETRCVNQAEVLYDGEKITIYSRQEAEELGGWRQLSGLTGSPSEVGASGNTAGPVTGSTRINESATEDSGGKINLNQADKSLLMTLSGVGEARADAIISYREKNGSFSAIEDVMKVTGIKERLFEQIRDKITV